jgi:hypothetical protein
MAFPCEPSIHADRASAKPALGTGFSGAVEGELPFGRDTSQKKKPPDTRRLFRYSTSNKLLN